MAAGRWRDTEWGAPRLHIVFHHFILVEEIECRSFGMPTKMTSILFYSRIFICFSYCYEKLAIKYLPMIEQPSSKQQCSDGAR